MKCLITGISGFAGSHLAERLLADDWSVYGLVRPDEFLGHLEPIRDRISLLLGDLTQPDSLDAIIAGTAFDVIFHLAGESSAHKSFHQPVLFFEVNVLGTVKLLEAVRKTGSKARIVLVTSSEIYGLVLPEHLPVTEETCFKPESPYAVSKVTVHYLGYQYFHNFGIPIIEARAFNHIGPRQSLGFVVPDFSAQLARIRLRLADPVITVGNLASKRDFVDVRDVVRAYHLLAMHGHPGQAYNICSGIAVSIREILERLIRIAACPVTVVQEPSKMRPSRMPEIRGSNARIAAAIDWRPQVSLDQSLTATLDYWLDQVGRTH